MFIYFFTGMEIVGPSKRVFTGLFVEVMWCLGELTLLLCAYFVRQWRYLELGLGFTSVFLMGYWW
jgi:OCT family organic cation transporter-like MFS transporter 4/5